MKYYRSCLDTWVAQTCDITEQAANRDKLIPLDPPTMKEIEEYTFVELVQKCENCSAITRDKISEALKPQILNEGETLCKNRLRLLLGIEQEVILVRAESQELKVHDAHAEFEASG